MLSAPAIGGETLRLTGPRQVEWRGLCVPQQGDLTVWVVI
jgi:hypothetical protein